MTKGAALQAWFETFCPRAYPETAVPDDVIFPFITYTPVSGAFYDGEHSITVNWWFHTESEKTPNTAAERMSAALGLGGVRLKCDGGGIWLKRGRPFCQSLQDETDRNCKRRYINLTAEFITAF